MKFTPGPWKVDENQNSAIIKPDESGFTQLIAETYAGDLVSDAALIASAPELLEACEKLLDMITDHRLHGPEIDFAVDAIAKAVGKE